MPIARVGDINIHYDIQGRGDPLLLIMGYGGSGFMWGEELLHPLSRHYQVIYFDNRGTGLTDKPDAEYTIPMMADDAAGLLSYLGIPNAHVFGVSMGGMIAQEVALRQPQQVKRLILGCTLCGGSQAIQAPPEVIEKLVNIPPDMPREEAVRQGWPVIFSPSFIEKEGDFLDRMAERSLTHPTPLHVMTRQMVAIQSFNTYDRLGQITMPTLVITGDADILVPPANSNILAEKIPSVSLKFVSGAGHGFFWEAPQETIALIRDFLSPA
jgi:pimeloyl-ACP methyl ester carboxylesterase